MKTKDDSNWVWGIFYYNKNDHRLFPPKKIPWMGWTVNFANPKSVVFFVGIMAFFLMIFWFIKRNQ